MVEAIGPLCCPSCGVQALPVWWSKFEPRPPYPAHEDPSSQVLLADATHACPACDWHGAPAYGTDDLLESVSDLLIVERVATLAELAHKISPAATTVYVCEKLATRNDRQDGVLLELSSGRRASLHFPFAHWRVRRTLAYLLDWGADAK